MLPKCIVCIDEIPLSRNGKVDRDALPAIAVTREEASRQPLNGPREEALATLWQALLTAETVSANDNFFTLGGDSLSATQAVAQIREQFGVQVSLADFFHSADLRALATHIDASDAALSEQSWPALMPNRAQRYQPFVLNDIQQAYWVGQQKSLTLGNVSCHFYLEMDSIKLDLPRFQQAWQRLIQRHDMLRAVILANGQQQVLEQVEDYCIVHHDLASHSASEQQQHLQKTRENLSRQMFQSDQWPLFEIQACTLDEHTTRLYFSFDLLICDVYSFLRLSAEWQQLYHGEDSLEPLTIGFRDYVELEAELLQEGGEHSPYAEDWRYWQARFDSLPAAPDLPLAMNPQDIKQPRFRRLDAHLPAADWQRVKQLAAAHQLTPSLLLCAAYAKTLAHWSRQAHFTLNLTLFNRLPVHPQVNQLVGDFTALLLLEVDYSPNMPFLDWARQLQQQLLADLEHRQLNGMRIVRECRRRRGTAFSLPVVFTSALPLQQGTQASETFPLSWLGERREVITQTPQVWLDHQVFLDTSGDLYLSWDVLEDLFPADMMTHMFDHYCRLLTTLGQPQCSAQQLANLPALPATQKRQRERLNAGVCRDENPLTLLHSALDHWVKSQPQSLAVVSSQRQLTYLELDQLSNRLGWWLRDRHVVPGQLVAVVMDKGWEQALACVAILKAGGAYLPLDPQWPSERLAFLLHNTDVRQVLTQQHWVEPINWPEQIALTLVDQDNYHISSPLPLPLVQSPSDLAYVIFTSGSTGVPKGVMIDHRGALNTIRDINRRFAVSSQDRILALSSLNFDLSVYDVFGAFEAGATVVIPDARYEREPAYWQQVLSEQKITLWNSVPALMSMLVAYGGEHLDLSSLRLVLLSGDWIPLDLPESKLSVRISYDLGWIKGDVKLPVQKIDKKAKKNI
jgi:yersiniabactin nonribosomal peptide synthetase